MSNLARFPGTSLRDDRRSEAADEAVDNIDPSFDAMCRLLNEASLIAVRVRTITGDPMLADELDCALSDALSQAESLRQLAEEEAAASVMESV